MHYDVGIQVTKYNSHTLCVKSYGQRQAWEC